MCRAANGHEAGAIGPNRDCGMWRQAAYGIFALFLFQFDLVNFFLH
jgi:hypothetical protein